MHEEHVTELARSRRRTFAGELIGFMRMHRKWWLGPIIVCMVTLALLMVLGGTALAPFLYTLF